MSERPAGPPKTEPESGRAGEPLPMGEPDRDPGGVSVEAKSGATEGFDLRYGRLISDCVSGWPSGKDCLLGSLAVEAAIGSAWSGSIGDASLSGGRMRKA